MSVLAIDAGTTDSGLSSVTCVTATDCWAVGYAVVYGAEPYIPAVPASDPPWYMKMLGYPGRDTIT